MLLTFPSGTVLADGKALCSDLKITIKPETMQGRLRYTDPSGTPVDFVVQGCTKPKITKMDHVEMTIFGVEYLTNTPFNLHLEFKIFKEIFQLTGRIGVTPISLQDKSIINLVLKTIETISQ